MTSRPMGLLFYYMKDMSHLCQCIDLVSQLEMRSDVTVDAVTTIFADGMFVGADVKAFQALEIPHNTSVCG